MANQILEPRPILELRSDVVDQIAAGEVVERPAHLVKELVENAIDAGARDIEVEFDQGGRWVRVTDDGVGIRPGDLARALARHATSKIQSADDLWRLQSYGFRGEALASIGAVSQLEILSRPKSEEMAHRVLADFGKVSPVEPSAGNHGTSVFVKQLFENVPARLKFMKSEAAEGSQVRSVVKASALSRPDVGFRLRSKGKNEFSFSKDESFLKRAESVLGVKLHETSGEFEGLKAQIAFSGPQDVLGNSKGLWFFVQDRWIQDRTLQAAVVEAYRGLLMHGEYPYAVIKITAPEGEVDVNIHPTKSAVKFRDNSRAFRVVSRTLRAAIETAPWLSGDTRGSARANVPAADRSADRASAISDSVARYSVNDFTRAYEKPSSYRPDKAEARSATGVAVSAAEASPVGSHLRFDSPALDQIQLKPKADGPGKSVAVSVGVAAPVPATGTKTGTETATETPTATGNWSRLEVLGQAALTYLICQDGDRLVFVDQHAAHERVAYERLMRAWKQKEADSALETQGLLIPLMINLEPELAEAVSSYAGDLKRIGLELELMGPTVVAISSLPVLLKESTIEKSIRELAQAIVDRGGSHVFEERIGDVFARMACHSVVRAGQALSTEQMRSLLKQMDEFPLSSFCPHGRPVSVEYPFSQLERDFGRIV